MKTSLLLLIYLFSFVSFFLILSGIGVLWTSYENVISEPNWFGIYSLFFGSWMAALPTCEYYELNKPYFKNIGF